LTIHHHLDDDRPHRKVPLMASSNQSATISPVEDYSDLFKNDISAISTAWELANPTPSTTTDAMMMQDSDRTSSIDISDEGRTDSKNMNIFVYSLRKLLISVPVYHVFNAYKYVKKMDRFRRVDKNEIIKLAMEDAQNAVRDDNDDDDDDDVPFDTSSSSSMSSDVSSESSLVEVR